MSFDCDLWRRDYDNLTFAAHKLAYDEIRESSPEQVCFDEKIALRALNGMATVTEIGGWRGELAMKALAAPSLHLSRWLNYEACSWAVGEGNRCDDERYGAVDLQDWPWNIDLPPADVFMASHVLEHVKWEQFVALSSQFRNFARLHFQIPTTLIEKPNWDGYDGTHILEVSWSEIQDHVVSLGFRLIDASPTLKSRTYQR